MLLYTFMIAVVTNYYNPSGNEQKLKNYLRFREGLDVPVYVVEAAFGDEPFTLSGENIIKVRCKDVIWQQYTLVNMAIRRLPDKFDKAVWIDADILFDDPWIDRMDDLLDDYKVAQTYGTVQMMSKGDVLGETRLGVVRRSLELGLLDLSAKFASGFSWGVQRDVIEKFGVYDYWITGSSDTAFCIGIWGAWEDEFFNRLNPQMIKHYLEWGKPFNDYIGGSVGYLDTNIKHLWHGHRNYRKRWQCLKNFNPYTDICIGDNGLEWCSDKPELHDCCRKMCLNYDMDFNPYL